ncbi:nucleoside recognition protein [Lachnospiraceae bacterium 62-35]
MLNYVWSIMMITGILWAAIHGNLEVVTEAALDSAKEAVTLGFSMLGIIAFWSGILEIGCGAGLIEQLSEKMKPVLKFLFPALPPGHPAEKQISINIIANMLGLGWAATPAGLKAMEELAKLEEERRNEETRIETDWSLKNGRNKEDNRNQKGRVTMPKKRLRPGAVPKGTASNEMCTFLIINISSLQLIPVNMIAYRSQYGSVNPAAVAGPAIAATAVSTLAAVVYCKVMDGKRRV